MTFISTWGDGVYWDVASVTDNAALHIFRRNQYASLCGVATRDDVEAYVGDHNGGHTTTCDHCKAQLANIRDKAARDMGLNERTA